MNHINEKINRTLNRTLSDGRLEFTDVIALTDVNYEKEEGGFEPIDSTLIQNGNDFEITKSKLKVKFSNDSLTPLVRSSKKLSDMSTNFKGLAVLNPSTMDFNFVGDIVETPTKIVDDNKITYKDIYPNIDLSYIHQGNQLKQEISIPESDRNFTGNSDDYLVIVTELISDDEIMIDENGITNISKYQILPEIAFFNERDFINDIPMKAWHKVIDEKTYLLSGIPLETVNDTLTNPGVLTLDPTDTLQTTDVTATTVWVGIGGSWAAVRDLATASASRSGCFLGTQESAASFFNNRLPVIVDMSSYSSTDILSSAEIQISPNQDLMTEHEDDVYWVEASLGGSIGLTDYINFTGRTVGNVHTPTYYTSALNTASMNFAGGFPAENKTAVLSAGLTDIQTAMDGSTNFEMLGIMGKDISNTLSGSASASNYIGNSPTTLDSVRLSITYASSQAPNVVTGVSASSDYTGVTLNFTTPATDGTHDLATSYEIWESDSTNGTYLQITGGSLADAKASAQPHSIKVVTSGAGANEVNDSELTAPVLVDASGISAGTDLPNDITVTFTEGSVTPGVTKFYRIIAVNAGGNSGYHSPTTGVSGARTDTFTNEIHASTLEGGSYSDVSGGDTSSPFTHSVTAPVHYWYKGRVVGANLGNGNFTSIVDGNTSDISAIKWYKINTVTDGGLETGLTTVSLEGWALTAIGWPGGGYIDGIAKEDISHINDIPIEEIASIDSI